MSLSSLKKKLCVDLFTKLLDCINTCFCLFIYCFLLLFFFAMVTNVHFSPMEAAYCFYIIVFSLLIWHSFLIFVLFCEMNVCVNKRQRIPKGQSNMDNPENLATQGPQEEGKQNKNTIQYVSYHFLKIRSNPTYYPRSFHKMYSVHLHASVLL